MQLDHTSAREFREFMPRTDRDARTEGPNTGTDACVPSTLRGSCTARKYGPHTVEHGASYDPQLQEPCSRTPDPRHTHHASRTAARGRHAGQPRAGGDDGSRKRKGGDHRAHRAHRHRQSTDDRERRAPAVRHREPAIGCSASSRQPTYSGEKPMQYLRRVPGVGHLGHHGAGHHDAERGDGSARHPRWSRRG